MTRRAIFVWLGGPLLAETDLGWILVSRNSHSVIWDVLITTKRWRISYKRKIFFQVCASFMRAFENKKTTHQWALPWQKRRCWWYCSLSNYYRETKITVRSQNVFFSILSMFHWLTQISTNTFFRVQLIFWNISNVCRENDIYETTSNTSSNVKIRALLLARNYVF